MNIGVLETGVVGNAFGTKLIQMGNNVKMGSRSAGNTKAGEWIKANGKNGKVVWYFSNT